MENMVKMILEVMITMSFCIVVLSVIKKITKNKYGYKIRYLLWYLIAIRLILPFNISLPTSFQIEEPSMPVIHVSNPVEFEEVKIAPEVSMKYEILNTYDKTDVLAKSGLEISYVAIGLGLSLTVSCLLILTQVIKYFRDLNILKRKSKKPSRALVNLFNTLQKSMGIHKDIPIYIVENLSSPMLVGVFKPFVVLPNLELSEEQVEMICMHELMHYKRKDVVFKWILMFIKSLYWFNPFVYLLYKEADKDIELSCDEMILKEKSLEYRKEYGFTILDVLKNQNKNMNMLLTTNFNSNKFVVKERIVGLLNTNVKKLSKNFVLGAMCVVLLSSMLVSCSSTETKNNVANRKINRLDTTEGTEYYFTIYNQEFGVKVLKDASFKMTVPEVIQADEGVYKKGDIAFSFVDKETGDVLMDLIYSTEDHYEITNEYTKNKKKLYSFNHLNENVNEVVQDYVILHDDYYLTEEVMNNSLNSCALIKPKDDDYIYVEFYTQDKLEKSYANTFIDKPENEIELTSTPDDRIGSNNIVMENCSTIGNQVSGVSGSVYQYERSRENDIKEFLKGTRVQPVGAFGKVYDGFYFDDILVVDEYYQIVDQISNK